MADLAHPIVSRGTAADGAAIRELLAASESTFDPDAELARSYARMWVARASADAAPQGVLLAWQVADELELIDLFVSASARRQGLGRALMRQLLAHGREHGSSVILLEVRPSNTPARTLYASFGFEIIGERERYYPDGEDALLLRLEIRTC